MNQNKESLDLAEKMVGHKWNWKKKDDKDAIEAKTKELTEASSGLAQRLYAEQQAQGGAEATDAAADAGAAEKGSADDAVDAEFEEVDDSKK